MKHGNSNRRKVPPLGLVLLALIFTSTGLAQTDEQKAELAKQSQNPVANMISLPLQFNFNFGLGEYDRSQMVINIQPVIPLKLNSKINIINRFILPVISQPDVRSESGSTFGLGNMVYTAFLTPAAPGALIWGVGPAFSIPTGTSPKLGGSDFGLGPSVVALTMPGKWVLGMIANQIWSYRQDSNLSSFFMQYFINYNLPQGWFVGTSPSISANWKAAEGEKWTVPFGLSVGKLARVGKRPIKLQLGVYFNAVQPTYGADWTLQFQAVLLYPKK
jgi:hypothetical protein